MKKLILFSLIIFSLFSCENQDWSFPDNAYSTVYFSYQYPVRTLTMGEDLWNTDLDNLHKCKIKATWGGGYTNPKNVTIDFRVDESLCDNLIFKSNGKDVMPMPANYYTLASNKIEIPKGSVSEGVEVQLTDAFFADPLALTRNYVIPLVMVEAYNVDSILRGDTDFPETANRCVPSDWNTVPKDYILYAVKYINEWDANYLRRGVDNVTKDGSSEAIIRHEEYVEKDEIWKLNTLSLSEIEYPLDYQNKLGTDLNMTMKLKFDDDSKCSVSATRAVYQLNDSVKVYNIAASGNGEFVKKGEKKSWGNKDRDALYLNYEVNYEVEITYPKLQKTTDIQKVKYSTIDTLVVRDRGVAAEYFEVSLK